MGEFEIHSKFKPTGDQPAAIESLVNGIKNNEKYQFLDIANKTSIKR